MTRAECGARVERLVALLVPAAAMISVQTFTRGRRVVYSIIIQGHSPPPPLSQTVCVSYCADAAVLPSDRRELLACRQLGQAPILAVDETQLCDDSSGGASGEQPAPSRASFGAVFGAPRPRVTWWRTEVVRDARYDVMTCSRWIAGGEACGGRSERSAACPPSRRPSCTDRVSSDGERAVRSVASV